MSADKYAVLMEKLENDELEGQSLGAEAYSQLLALYLYRDDLMDAKYLWMRMPPALKSCEELKCLHHLLKCALSNNSGEFIKTTKFNWSDKLKPIIKDIIEKRNKSIMEMVGEAYTSIREADLANMTQLPSEELQKQCHQLEWGYEQSGDQRFIIPKCPPPKEEPVENPEDQLATLTDFVTFLEG